MGQHSKELGQNGAALLRARAVWGLLGIPLKGWASIGHNGETLLRAGAVWGSIVKYSKGLG